MMIPGITTTNNDDVKLIVGDTATEHLMITEAIKLGSGNLFLDVAGNVTQTTTGTITAAGLALMVDGNTMLGLGNKRRYAGRQHRWHDFLQRQRRLDGGHGQRECLAGDDDDPGHHHHK